MSSLHPESTPVPGRRLSRLLDRWATARRLDARQADAIRQAIRAAPVDLGFDWWWRLLDPDRGSVFRATAARSAFAEVSGLSTGLPPFAADIPGHEDWPQDDVAYQPYLRLT